MLADSVFSVAPSREVIHDTLIAVSAVAAAVWTGGIVALSLRKFTLSVYAGLDVLQFAMFVPLVGLLAPSPILRAAIVVLILLYLALNRYYYFLLLQAQTLEIPRIIQDVVDTLGITYSSETKRQSVINTAIDLMSRRLTLQRYLMSACGFLPLLILVIWPTTLLVAALSIMMLLVGLNYTIFSLMPVDPRWVAENLVVGAA
jgi:hypothetical protein